MVSTVAAVNPARSAPVVAIDKNRRPTISRNGASKDDDQVTNSQVVELVVDVATARVPNGR